MSKIKFAKTVLFGAITCMLVSRVLLASPALAQYSDDPASGDPSTGDPVLNDVIRDRQNQQKWLDGQSFDRRSEYNSRRQAEQSNMIRFGFGILILTLAANRIFFAFKNQSQLRKNKRLAIVNIIILAIGVALTLPTVKSQITQIACHQAESNYNHILLEEYNNSSVNHDEASRKLFNARDEIMSACELR